MIFKYGNYSHDDNEVWFDVDFRTIYSDVGVKQNIRGTWIVYGVKKGEDASDLTDKLEALETAYSIQGADIGFYDNSGTLTRHFMLSAVSTDGVQVESFKYLPGNGRHWGSGTEYVNMRSYRIILTANLIDCPLNVVSWRERIVGIGTGGPKFIYKGALTGPPQKQIIQQQTSFQAIQEGSGIGYFEYPFVATPFAPQHEHLGRRRVSLYTPKFGAVRNSLYRVDWSYFFESSTALVGSPSGF